MSLPVVSETVQYTSPATLQIEAAIVTGVNLDDGTYHLVVFHRAGSIEGSTSRVERAGLTSKPGTLEGAGAITWDNPSS